MFENEIIKLPTWTKCAIFWSFYNMYNALCLFLYRLCSVFLFSRPALETLPCPTLQHNTLLMTYVLFFCCKIILKEKRLKKVKKKKKKREGEKRKETKQFASSSTAVSFSCPGCSWWSSQQVYYCNLNKDNRTYEIKKSPIDKLMGCVSVVHLAWKPREVLTLKYTGNYCS